MLIIIIIFLIHYLFQFFYSYYIKYFYLDFSSQIINNFNFFLFFFNLLHFILICHFLYSILIKSFLIDLIFLFPLFVHFDSLFHHQSELMNLNPLFFNQIINCFYHLYSLQYSKIVFLFYLISKFEVFSFLTKCSLYVQQLYFIIFMLISIFIH